jgi:hypothetical protein
MASVVVRDHRTVSARRRRGNWSGSAIAVTGRYLKSRREQRTNPAAYDTGLQEALLAACAALTGARLPG